MSDTSVQLYREFLVSLGVDMTRDGLEDTPARVVAMYEELLTRKEIKATTFMNDGEYDSLVILKGIPFYTLCEHHLLPFFGEAHVCYLPGERVIGLSKIARFVEQSARDLQVQERMTVQIAKSLMETLKTEDVGVVLQARHLCMEMRGVTKPGVETETNALFGELRSKPSMKNEFLSAIVR